MPKILFALLISLLVVHSSIVMSQDSTSVINYIGVLTDDGLSANGEYDLIFTLFDKQTNGVQIGNSMTFENEYVQTGRIILDLDFGIGVFDGNPRFLQIAIRRGNDEGSYTELTPRQEIKPSPYAIYAQNAPRKVNGTDGIGFEVVNKNSSGVGIIGQAGSSEGNSPIQSASNKKVSGLESSTERNAPLLDPTQGIGVLGRGEIGVKGEGKLGVLGESSAENGSGVGGASEGAEGSGVEGMAYHASAVSYGVRGSAISALGYGVYGENLSKSDIGIGVYGKSENGFGVNGDGKIGVGGMSEVEGGIGVAGSAISAQGESSGVEGETNSPRGYGVFGVNNSQLEGGTAVGVKGLSSKGIGVLGEGAVGVLGESSAENGSGVGGTSEGSEGVGVEGMAYHASAVSYGVRGSAISALGYGVYGENLSKSDIGIGVYGKSENGFGVTGDGKIGVGGMSEVEGGIGVAGSAISAQGESSGVEGETNSPRGYGVFGVNNSQLEGGTAVGVKGLSSKGIGVLGEGAVGVLGESSAENGSGVGGTSEGAEGSGVEGMAYHASAVSYGVRGSAISALGYGVHGENLSKSDLGIGVHGKSENGTGVDGEGKIGVAGMSDNEEGIGVCGASLGKNGVGVAGDGGANNVGGRFMSTNNVALLAQSEKGNPFEAWNGNEAVFRVSNSGNVYADGTYQSPAADFAEMLPAAEGLEPGDVLSISPEGKAILSDVDKASSIMGVYSTKPAFLGGISGSETGSHKVPVAIMGVVPVKTSNENGPVRPNDVLTASSKYPGHACKAKPLLTTENGQAIYAGGTILGRALSSLDGETGLVKALIQLR